MFIGRVKLQSGKATFVCLWSIVMRTIMLSAKATLRQSYFHIFVEGSDAKTVKVVLLLSSKAGSFQVFSHSYYLVAFTIAR